MKKRLLVFHQALAPYRLDLFNSLNRLFELRLVFVSRNVSYQKYDQDGLMAQLDADCSFLDRGFSFSGYEVRYGVSAEIRNFAPDAIVSPEFSLLSLQMACSRYPNNPRHIVWTADSPETAQADKISRRIVKRLILPRIDGLIVYSAATKECYENRYRKLPQIGISPNAQSEAVFHRKLAAAQDHARQLAQEFSLAGKKVLLYVGRLAEVKRIDRLLHAFAGTLGKREDIVLVIVGGGPANDALTNLARHLGIAQQTIFTGHLEGAKLHAWFNLGSVFVLPSGHEPWGAVVNEALIAGIPVVCSQQVGARVLVASGVNGDVVDADDPGKFGAALSKWLDNATALDLAATPPTPRSLMTEPFSSAVEGFRSVVEG